jgi:hypothetical protein
MHSGECDMKYRRGCYSALGFTCVMIALGLLTDLRWPLWWAAGGASLALACFVAARWRHGYLLVYVLIALGAVGGIAASLRH